jgi:hypothetical protein
MLVKRIIIAGFVSSSVLSLTAMELDEYAYPWSTPVLVIKEFTNTSNMPKDIANCILVYFYQVHAKEHDYWKNSRLAKSIGVDNDCEFFKRILFKVGFSLSKQQKQGLPLICNSLSRERAPEDKEFKPLTQKEYQEFVLAVPTNVRCYFPCGAKVTVIENESIVRQILSGSKGRMSVLQSSLCGGLMGVAFYSFLKRMTGGYLSLAEFFMCTGIGASCSGIITGANNWLKVRSLPAIKKMTLIYCPLLSDEESKKLLAEKLLAEKKLENMHCKMLIQLQKDQKSKNLLLQYRE